MYVKLVSRLLGHDYTPDDFTADHVTVFLPYGDMEVHEIVKLVGHEGAYGFWSGGQFIEVETLFGSPTLHSIRLLRDPEEGLQF